MSMVVKTALKCGWSGGGGWLMPEGPAPLPRIEGGVNQSPAHDSAHKHVSGAALFIDDIPEPAGLVHVYLGLSTQAHARIASLDLAKVAAAPA